MAEGAFSPDGKYYSAISQDGRLRIWDTETNVLKQEYTPDLHLTSPPSCLQWIRVSQSRSSAKKSAKRNSISEEVQCIALGTASGKIILYSVAQAKVETVFEDINSENTRKRISSLDWHIRYGLYSCNTDNIVHEWDIQSASVINKHNLNVEDKSKQSNRISAIKIVPYNQNTAAKFLVTASYQVRVWRLDSDSPVVLKTLGHRTAPRAMLCVANLENRCWLIEGSQNERLISFWDITITSEHLPQLNGEEVIPSKRQRKKSISETIITPNYNFLLEDAPRSIDVDIKDNGGTTVVLAAVTRSGVVHYYNHLLNGPSAKPIKPSVTIQVTKGDAHPLPLQCCMIPPQGDPLLGYSNGPAMLFEKVTPDLKSKTQVLIRIQSKKKNKQAKNQEVNKVVSGTSNNVTYIEPMGGVVTTVNRKRIAPGANIEVPMEERLSNLAIDVKSGGKSAVNENMSKLLIQGLHSKDKNIIHMVLQNDDSKVALRTLSSLPPAYVPTLLNELTEMATTKTSHCASACTWLLAVLRCHSAMLLATANTPTSDGLLQLLAIFTHRRSHLCQLLNLKGRLDLTMSQRNRVKEQDQQEPILEYNDSTSEEEVEAYQSDESDVQSWTDDVNADNVAEEDDVQMSTSSAESDG